MRFYVNGNIKHYVLTRQSCDHRNAYGITSGWYCPDCGHIIPLALTPYRQSTGGDINYNNYRQTGWN